MSTGPMIAWAVVVGLALFAVAVLAVRHTTEHWVADGGTEDRSGWVYFLSGPDTAIKVGSTQRDPTQDRLPEIRTMSPVPLRIIFKFRAPDVRAAESKVHEKLASHRLHGEWFDRDATLAYIDYLKGAYE